MLLFTAYPAPSISRPCWYGVHRPAGRQHDLAVIAPRPPGHTTSYPAWRSSCSTNKRASPTASLLHRWVA